MPPLKPKAPGLGTKVMIQAIPKQIVAAGPPYRGVIPLGYNSPRALNPVITLRPAITSSKVGLFFFFFFDNWEH